MIQGIAPIVFTPFDDNGDIDSKSLSNIVRFELDGGVHAIGINGFASEAYKLIDAERHQNVEIIASEVANQVPLIIGIAAGSTEAAIRQAKEYAPYKPAALMTLPPATMDNGIQSFVDHYIALGNATDIPIIVQQSPHIPQYSHCELPEDALAEIANRAPSVKYFKIEGHGSSDKMKQLQPLLDEDQKMFGGGGGITVLTELRNGAAGLIPGTGFNEIFIDAWDAWSNNDHDKATDILQNADSLIKAVSGHGHEYSLHVRKHLMKRAGYINSVYVRRPTIDFHEYDMPAIFDIVDALNLRISQ
jgi:dihydrodipicolinate synthase/N-acetylneuraminate lyase